MPLIGIKECDSRWGNAGVNQSYVLWLLAYNSVTRFRAYEGRCFRFLFVRLYGRLIDFLTCSQQPHRLQFFVPTLKYSHAHSPKLDPKKYCDDSIAMEIDFNTQRRHESDCVTCVIYHFSNYPAAQSTQRYQSVRIYIAFDVTMCHHYQTVRCRVHSILNFQVIGQEQAHRLINCFTNSSLIKLWQVRKQSKLVYKFSYKTNTDNWLKLNFLKLMHFKLFKGLLGNIPTIGQGKWVIKLKVRKYFKAFKQ